MFVYVSPVERMCKVMPNFAGLKLSGERCKGSNHNLRNEQCRINLVKLVFAYLYFANDLHLGYFPKSRSSPFMSKYPISSANYLM